MNNYTNLSNLNNQMNVRDFEIAEARRRMGTSTNNTQNMGMTNNIPTNVPSLSSSTSTGNAEAQNARQNMGTSANYSPQNMGMGMTNSMSPGYSGMTPNYTNLSSLSGVPDLDSSTSVGYSEIRKAKQDMNTGSSTNFTS